MPSLTGYQWKQIEAHPSYRELDEPGRKAMADQWLADNPSGSSESADDTRWSDYARQVGAGVTDLVSLGGRALDVAGMDRFGQAVESGADAATKALESGTTPAYRRLASQPFIERDDGGGWDFGGGWNRAKIMGLAARSLPSTAVGMGGGLAVGAGLRATIGASRISAATANMIGAGLTEGVMSGGQGAKDAYDTVMRAPEERLSELPEYQAALSNLNGDAAKARKAVAGDMAVKIGAALTLAGGAAGAPAGRVYGKMLAEGSGGMVKRTLKGAATEAMEEIPQSGMEQAAQNVVARRVINPDTPLTEGMAEAMVGGMVAGAGVGGVFGAVTAKGKGTEGQRDKGTKNQPMGDPASEVERIIRDRAAEARGPAPVRGTDPNAEERAQALRGVMRQPQSIGERVARRRAATERAVTPTAAVSDMPPAERLSESRRAAAERLAQALRSRETEAAMARFEGRATPMDRSRSMADEVIDKFRGREGRRMPEAAILGGPTPEQSMLEGNQRVIRLYDLLEELGVANEPEAQAETWRAMSEETGMAPAEAQAAVARAVYDQAVTGTDASGGAAGRTTADTARRAAERARREDFFRQEARRLGIEDEIADRTMRAVEAETPRGVPGGRMSAPLGRRQVQPASPEVMPGEVEASAPERISVEESRNRWMWEQVERGRERLGDSAGIREREVDRALNRGDGPRLAELTSGKGVLDRHARMYADLTAEDMAEAPPSPALPREGGGSTAAIAPAKPKGEGARTVRGRIMELGGLNMNQLGGEGRDLDIGVRKAVIRKGGVSPDLVERTLKEEGWLSENETLVDMLRDDPTETLRRGRLVDMDIDSIKSKPDRERTPRERQLLADLEAGPEAPPEAIDTQVNAEDLPEGATMDMITPDGKWDRFRVTEKDPFEITLQDGETVKLRPMDQVQVASREMGASPSPLTGEGRGGGEMAAQEDVDVQAAAPTSPPSPTLPREGGGRTEAGAASNDVGKQEAGAVSPSPLMGEGRGGGEMAAQEAVDVQATAPSTPPSPALPREGGGRTAPAARGKRSSRFADLFREAADEVEMEQAGAPEGYVDYAFAGQRAKGADRNALTRAEAMTAEGADTEAIRRETGWFKGVDDMWRFEISDREMALRPPKRWADRAKSGEPVYMFEAIKHKKLFDNYPLLKNVKIEVDPERDASAAFGNGKVYVAENLLNDEKMLKRAIIHELQHAIQESERFAAGGSAGQFMAPPRDKAEIAAQIADMDARANRDTGREPLTIEELQAGDVEPEVIFSHAEDWEDAGVMPFDDAEALIDEFFADDAGQREMNAVQKYERLAGEVESRDAEARMGMSGEERRKVAPYESQGIDRDDMIVRFDETEMFSATPATVPLTAEDVQRTFPTAQVDQQGDDWRVTFPRGDALRIKKVDHIAPDAAAFQAAYRRPLTAMEKRMGAVGQYKDGEIKISRQGDRWTLNHEAYHFLERRGFLTKAEVGAIDKAAGSGGDGEARARWIESELERREFDRHSGPVRRALQRLADMLDGLVNMVKATGRGVVRGMESGGMYGRGSGVDARTDTDGQGRARTTDADERADYALRALPDRRYDFQKDLDDLVGSPKKETKSVRQVVRETYEKTAKRWRAGMFDRLDPIKRQVGADVHRLFQMEAGAPAVVQAFFEDGARLEMLGEGRGRTPIVRKDGKGYLKWLEQRGEDAGKALYWGVARRAEKMSAEERENWFDADAIRRIDQAIGDRASTGEAWSEVFKEHQAYNESVLKFARKAGLMDAEALKRWEADIYVPFYRVLEDPGKREEFLRAVGQGGKHVREVFQKLEGGKARIGDPVETVLKNWSAIISESVRNVSRQELVQKAEESNGLSMIEGPDGGRLPLIERVSAGAALKFRGKIATPNEAAPIVSYMEDGKRVHMKINDPELYAAVSNLKRDAIDGTIMKAFGASKRLLTYGATLGAGFRIANPIRDTLHGAIVTKSLIPFVDLWSGMAKVWRNDPDFVAMKSGMAGFSGDYLRADDPEATQRYLDKIIKREGQSAAGRILTAPKKLLRFWEKVGEAGENATRVQLYSKTFAAARKSGKSEAEAHAEASFQARDFLDFSMGGEWAAVRYLTQTVPFMNARLQGLYKLGRAAGENPLSFGVKGGLLALASLGLWAANKDRDEWKSLEDWDKWQYYHFWVGGYHYRIPKPFEVGALFSTITESIGEVASGNRELGYMAKVFQDIGTNTLAFNPTPQLVKPLFEQWANKSSFTGRPIVNQALARLEPGAQSQPWTSETLQYLGESFGVSPVRAQEILNGYTASIGSFALSAADPLFRWMGDFPERPAKRVDDYPVIGRFMKEANKSPRNSAFSQRFYEMADETNKLAATIKYYSMTGDYQKAKDLAEGNRASLGARKGLNRARRSAGEVNRTIRAIWRNGDMSGEEKSRRIDRLLEKREEIFRRAVE